MIPLQYLPSASICSSIAGQFTELGCAEDPGGYKNLTLWLPVEPSAVEMWFENSNLNGTVSLKTGLFCGIVYGTPIN